MQKKKKDQEKKKTYSLCDVMMTVKWELINKSWNTRREGVLGSGGGGGGVWILSQFASGDEESRQRNRAAWGDRRCDTHKPHKLCREGAWKEDDKDTKLGSQIFENNYPHHPLILIVLPPNPLEPLAIPSSPSYLCYLNGQVLRVKQSKQNTTSMYGCVASLDSPKGEAGTTAF